METRIVTFETKGVTTFRDSLHLHSSERSFPLSSSRRKHKPFSQSPTLHLPVNIPIIVWRSLQNRTYQSQWTRSWRVRSTKRNMNAALIAMFITSWYFATFVPLSANLRLSLARATKTRTVSAGLRREHRYRNSEPPIHHLPAWRW